MEITTAIRLIEKGISKTDETQSWADLGAGDGLFSRALSTLLPAGSLIYAVDKNGEALKRIKNESLAVRLKTLQQDFVQGLTGMEPLQGILMVNSLHFVAEQPALFLKLKKNLQPGGRLVVVEYEMEYSTRWVPYPVSFGTLKKLAIDAGFALVTKIGEEPSVFNQAVIYAALIS